MTCTVMLTTFTPHAYQRENKSVWEEEACSIKLLLINKETDYLIGVLHSFLLD